MTTTTTAKDAEGALEIIQLLANDTKYKQRFDEMQQLAAKLNQYKLDGEATRRAADEVKATADQAMAEVHRKLAEAKDFHQKAQVRHGQAEEYEKRLSNLEAELRAKADQLFSARESALAAKHNELKVLENSLYESDAELTARSIAHEKRERQHAAEHNQRVVINSQKEDENRREAARLAELRMELEAKHEKLKAFVAGV